MRFLSVMGGIRLKLLCLRFLNHPWKSAVGLFAPAVWCVRFALARWRMDHHKKNTGGLVYENLEC